jgi:elongation factor P
MASTADFRNGMVIKYNNDFFTIVEFQHVKPGKGAAFVRTKLKSVTTGKVIENTFPSGAKVETARIERRPYQFLYNDELGFHFMHTETFEQLTLPEDHINTPKLLKENQQVEILFHDESETPIRCELPQFVELEVEYTEPGIKGDTTSTTALKPATLETGAEIKVPLFINTGEMIKVDTRDSSYVERIKK